MSNDRVGLAEKLPGEAWRWLAGNNDEVVVRMAEMPRALDRVSHVRAFLAEVSDACDDRARDDRTVQSSLEAKFFHDILLHFVAEWGKVRQKFIDPNPAG